MNSTKPGFRGAQWNRGFTLIDVLIVVALIAILLAIALPSYNEHTLKSKRSIARTHLLDIAGKQQEFFLNNKSYAGNLTALGYDSDTVGVNSKGNLVAAGAGDSVYDFSVTSSSALAYALQASAANSQTQDSYCGNFTLDSTGIKGASGSLGADCWN